MSTAEIGPWVEGADTEAIPLPRSPWQPEPTAAASPARRLGRPPEPWTGTGPVALTDAALALAAAHDPAAFAAIYDRYSDRLHDFCLGMLRDRDAAADAVQDTFTTAAARLTQLREPDKLRPWLYAIARHEALRHIRSLRRETPRDELPEQASPEHGPEELAARGELAELITQAAGGLSDRDRAVLDLHYRHGLDGPELADALGVSHSNANTLVGRLRGTLERSLGALLLARGVRDGTATRSCPELVELLAGWDGQFSVLWRKRIARHSDRCQDCLARRQQLANPRALLGAAPMLIPAPGWLRAHVLAHTTTRLAPNPTGGPGSSTGAAGTGSGASGSWWPAATGATVIKPLHVAVIAPLLAVGSAVGLIGMTTTAPTTTNLAASSTAGPGAGTVSPSAPPSFGFDMPTTQLNPPGATPTPPGGPRAGQPPAGRSAPVPPVQGPRPQTPPGPVPPGQAPAGPQLLPRGPAVPGPITAPPSQSSLGSVLGDLATIPGVTPPRHKHHHHRGSPTPTPTTTPPPPK